MAVRATNQVPADAYAEFKHLCNTLKAECLLWVDLLAGDVDADQVWMWYRELYAVNRRMGEIAAVPGIVEYAVAQEADPTYDIGTEFGLLISRLVAAYQWIYAAIPRDASGYTLTHTTTVEGARVPAIYPPVATAPLVPYLQAVADSIV